ncbi:cadherin-like domain-containing protein [Alphaproteobacteria bacterium LSUCC0684]
MEGNADIDDTGNENRDDPEVNTSEEGNNETDEINPTEEDDASSGTDDNTDPDDNTAPDDQEDSDNKDNTDDIIDENDVLEITSGGSGLVLPERVKVEAEKVVYTAEGTYDLAAIIWSLVAGDDGNLFEIDKDSGKVTFQKGTTPDFETKDTYTFTVRATSGLLTADQVVTLAVEDVDEVPTAMTLTASTGRVAEGVTAARQLAEIGFTDDVPGVNTAEVNTVEVGGKVLFEIRSGTQLWLKAGVDLDHETATSHVVTVTPSVSGTGSAPPAQTFTLQVSDENEAPEITSGGSGLVLPERVKVEAEKVVYTAEGTYDLAAIIWSLVAGDDGNLFEIDKDSGKVTFKAAVTPDFETKDTYTFTVRATSGLLTADQQVTLAVEDVDEVPTAMTLTASTGSVAEGVTAARKLADIGFTDDVPGVNTAEVNTVEVGGKVLFEIRSGTQLWLKAGVDLDHETATSHVVTVTPSVSGTGSAPPAQTFTLQVTDENDVLEITSGGSGLVLPERVKVEAEKVVYTAEGTYDLAAIIWSLVAGDDGNLFEIDKDSGEVTFQKGTTPDFETKDTYTFTVRATSGLLTADQQVTLAVEDVDEVPTAMTLTASTASVAEGVTAARQLAAIGFTDDVPGVNTATVNTVEVGGKVLFEIRSGTQLWLKAGVDLDHETATSHVVTVTPSVSGTGSAPPAQTFTLQVTDENDVLEITSGGSGLVLPERVKVEADKVVYTAEGTYDLAAIIWSLVAGDDGNLFEIDKDSGEVTFQKGTTPDFETKDTYTFTVRATSGLLTADQVVTLAVSDVDEAPSAMTLTASTGSVAEGVTAARQLAAIGFTDDVPGVNTAEVNTVEVGGKVLFEIRSGTQLWLKAGVDLDHETATSHVVTVTPSVSGTGSAPPAQTFTLQVSDENEAPEITSGGSGLVLPERVKVEAEKVVYTAEGTYDLAAIIWSLVAGDDGNLFEIDKDSGEVTFQKGTTPDFETKDTYTFTVRATSGLLTADQVVTLAVSDVDEAPSAMTLTASTGSVAEGVTAARQLAEIGFTDDVPGTNTATVNTVEVGGKVLFEIRSGTQLWLKAGVDLDHETATSHVVTVTPSVSGTGSAPPAQTFTLQVSDENEAPEITSGGSGLVLPERVKVEAEKVVYTAEGTYDLASIIWSLVAGDDGNLFEIDKDSGKVTFKAAVTPDFETKDTYTFTVRATSGLLTADQQVTLAVSDVDEAPSAMTLTASTGSVAEGVTAARQLAEIGFTDDVPGVNTAEVNTVEVGGKVLFEIRSGTQLWLKAGVDLDHETATSHVVTVTPSVSGTGSAPPAQTFTLQVTDENEAPEITSGGSGLVLPERVKVEAEKVVYTAEGTYDLASIIWSLVAGDDGNLFEIDKDSGEVTFKAAVTPDFETKDTYTFTVRATSGLLTADQQVTLAVSDVDEAPSAMTLTASTGRVAEGVTAARQLAEIGFTDDVPGVNTAEVNTVEVGGKVLFEIRSGTQLWLKAGVDLDHETATSHVVTVTPSVSGTGSAPAAQTFTLQVSDVDEKPERINISPSIKTVHEGRVSGAMDLFTITYGGDDLTGVNTPSVSISRTGVVDYDKRPNVLMDDDFQIVASTDEDGDTIRNSYILQIKDGVLLDGDSLVNGLNSIYVYTLNISSTTSGVGEDLDSKAVNLLIANTDLAITVNIPNGESITGGWRLNGAKAADDEIGTVTASGPMNTTITFALTDPAGLFSIDKDTGAISTKAAVTSSMSTTVTITAMAEAEDNLDQQVRIEINLTNADAFDLMGFEDRSVSHVSTTTDSDGDSVSFAETAAAVQTNDGSYTVSNTGELVYTPDSDFIGTDTFTINIKDEHGAEGTAEVNVSVAKALDVKGDLGVRENAPETLPDNRLAGATSGRVSSIDPGRNIALYMIASVNGTDVAADGTAIDGSYGTITFDRDGSWRYVLDNSNATVNALDGDDDDADGANGNLTETINFSMSREDDPLTTGIDEAETLTQSFSITIHGVTDVLGPDESLFRLTAGDDYYLYQDNTITLPSTPFIITSSGDDIFDAIAETAGISGGSINAGDGDDIIYGNANAGLLVIKAGAGDDIIFGGPKLDSISGGVGNDIIDGGDAALGDLDEDTYFIDPDDRVSGENTAVNLDLGSTDFWGFDRASSTWKTGTGAGYSYIRSWFDLDRDGVQDENDEYDYLTEIEKINFTGLGDAADTITGGSVNDIIRGGAGADTLSGGDGQDSLDGGAGDDLLSGGKQQDQITLGAGDDIVLYSHDLHKAGTGHADVISDFSRGTVSGDANFNGSTAGGDDRIRLSNTTDAAAYLAIYNTLQSFPGHFPTGSSNDGSIVDTLIYRVFDSGVRTLVMVLEDYSETLTVDHFDLDAVPDIDRKPTGLSLAPTAVSLDEGSIAADTTLSSISFTDDGRGTNTAFIEGFVSSATIGKLTIKINDSYVALVLKAGSVLDYEDIAGGQVTLTIKSASTGIGQEPSTVNFTLTVNDIDERPTGMVFTPAAYTLNDNSLASSAIKLTTVSFTDDAKGTNTFTISDTENYEIQGGNQIWLKAVNHNAKNSGPHELTITPSTTGTGVELSPATFTLTIDKRPTGLSYNGHKISFDEGRYAAERIGTLTISDDGYGDVVPSLILRGKGSFSSRLPSFESQFEYRETDNPLIREIWLKENAYLDYEAISQFAGGIDMYMNFDYENGTTGIGSKIASSRISPITIKNIPFTLDVSIGSADHPNIIQVPSAGLLDGDTVGSITVSAPMGQTITTTLAELDSDGNEFSEKDLVFTLDDTTIELRKDHTAGSTHRLRFTTSTEGETTITEDVTVSFNTIRVAETPRSYDAFKNIALTITLQGDGILETNEKDLDDEDLITPAATTEDIDTGFGIYKAVGGTGTFTPNTDFTGSVTFTIPVMDARGGTSTKTILVTIKEPVKDKRSSGTVRDDAPLQDPIHIPLSRALGIVELNSDTVQMIDEFSLYTGGEEITDTETGKEVTSTYGKFTIFPSGRWQYDLNSDHAQVNALTGSRDNIASNSLTDTVTVEFRRTDDGGEVIRFSQPLRVTILGTSKVVESSRGKTHISIDGEEDYFFGSDITAANSISGGAGDDIIDGSHLTNLLFNGKHTFTGGDGDDYLIASQTKNTLLDGGRGRNILIGMGGDDSLASGSGQDVIDGGGGVDMYASVAPGAATFGVDENGNHLDIAIRMDAAELKWRYDSYQGEWVQADGGSNDGHVYDYTRLIYDFPGDDETLDRITYLRNVERFEISGIGNAADRIVTTGNYDDVFITGRGDDLIWAGGGDDRIKGGQGDDQLYGQDGDDTIEGKNGDDEIEGGAGDDMIKGGQGRDIIKGGKGNDIIATGSGGDFIHIYLGDHAEGETNRQVVTDFKWEKDATTGRATSGSDILIIETGKDASKKPLENLRFSVEHYFEQFSNRRIPEENVDDDDEMKDLLIFNRNGTTSDDSDDILVMVLLDFTTDEVINIDSALFFHNFLFDLP